MNFELYLAVSESGWERLSNLNFVQRRIKQFHLQFLIVDITQKKIVQWIK
ncbi:MAG: element excision factor XisH family protein [Saprospiraceae bacterium]